MITFFVAPYYDEESSEHEISDGCFKVRTNPKVYFLVCVV